MKDETPLIVPAPAGTYVLHVIRDGDKLAILKHVCVHFERFDDRIVPRCLIAAGDNVIEGAVLHPDGLVSGSPARPITFENVDSYRADVLARRGKPTTGFDGRPTKRSSKIEKARALLEEDLVG